MLAYRGETYEMQLTIDVRKASRFGVNLLKSGAHATTIEYDVKSEVSSLDRSNSGNVGFHKRFAIQDSIKAQPVNRILSLQILVARSVVELFVNEGEAD